MKKKHHKVSPMKVTKNHFKTSSLGKHPVIANGMGNQASNMGAAPTACTGECMGQDMSADDVASQNPMSGL